MQQYPILDSFLCFNPRTREGCDLFWLNTLRNDAVSIHAPVKGATLFVSCYLLFFFVSIHAPVKGATNFQTLFFLFFCCFNPRTREGCDLGNSPGVLHRHYVSIHAPVKGATRTDVSRDDPINVSIHAPVKGATWIAYKIKQ